MKKKQLIVVIIIVLIILVGGGFFLSKHSMSPSQAGQTANSAMQSATGKKSLFDFFSMTGSQKCTFTNSSTNNGGTVYVSSGKMRGDFQEKNNSTGASEQTHMINDGTYVYIWTDGQNNGYKMSESFIKQEESQPTEAPANGSSANQPSQAVDMHQQVNTSCGAWTADASMFVPPTNITFTDYSSMMQGAGSGTAAQSGAAPQGMSAQQKQTACSACNQVPAGAMRNQCLAQLKCQ